MVVTQRLRGTRNIHSDTRRLPRSCWEGTLFQRPFFTPYSAHLCLLGPVCLLEPVTWPFASLLSLQGALCLSLFWTNIVLYLKMWKPLCKTTTKFENWFWKSLTSGSSRKLEGNHTGKECTCLRKVGSWQELLWVNPSRRLQATYLPVPEVLWSAGHLFVLELKNKRGIFLFRKSLL